MIGEDKEVETKEIILKIAIKSFIEEGFWEVPINSIIKELGMNKSEFNSYFKSKDQLICETIDKCFFSHFANIFRISNKHNITSKEKLQRIFQNYSETIDYLKKDFNVKTIKYESIICLFVTGTENYVLMTKYIKNFNKTLLEKIESIIEEGKISGEIIGTIDSKFTANSIFTELQNSIVLWAMNQKIDIKMLFEINFKYLWSNIRLGAKVYEKC